MVVQHNLTAMNSDRMLNITVKSQADSAEKLSSGYKVNRAADDAAGLSISEKMRKQIRGLTQASSNAQDGISMVQTAEGALNEVQDMLQRMNELAVKAANGTLSPDDRGYIQNEVDQLMTEIDRVAQTTKFNETYLLDSGYTIGDPVTAFYGKMSEDIVGTNADLLDNHTLGTYSDSAILSKLGLTAGTTINYVSLSGDFAGHNHAAGFLDLSGLTTHEDVLKLLGTGVSATCTGCEGFLGIKFVDNGSDLGLNANGYKIVSNGSPGSGYTGQNVWVDISSCNSGADVVQKVLDVSATILNSGTATTGSNTKAYAIAGIDHHVGLMGNGSVLCLLDSQSSASVGVKEDGYLSYGGFGNGYVGRVPELTLEKKEVGLHVGADATSNNQITVELANISTVALGLKAFEFNWRTETAGMVNYANVTTQDDALKCIDAVKSAIQVVSTIRSRFGAIQNRLDHTINNLDNVVENTTAAESSIRDTDMATEMVRYSNNNILAQAGQAMLAQSNQANQGVLSLLG